MIVRLATLAAVFGLVGCSTPYNNPLGGPTVETGADGVMLVRAGGNALTSEEKVADFVMLKAAETTQQAGRTCFEIISSDAMTNSELLSTAYGSFGARMPSAHLRFRFLEGVTECEANAPEIIARLRLKLKDSKNYK